MRLVRNSFAIYNKAALLPVIMTFLASCGGGGGGGSSDPSTNTDSGAVIPSGKIMVDGHIFNPGPLEEENGPVNVKITYFNPDGSKASYHELWEWSGEEPTYLTDWRYDYDENGNLISEEQELTYTREGPALYTHSFTETEYTYYPPGQASAGKLKSETRVQTALDTNGDGVYTDDNTGATLEIITHTYDSEGNKATTVRDDDGDGLVNTSNDTETTYSYDSSDRVSQETITSIFGDSEYFTYEYDNITNNVVKKKWFYNTTNLTNDTPDEVFSYFYDSEGRTERIEHDYGVSNSSDSTLDGISDKTTYYRYGSNGDLTEIQVDLIRISSKESRITKHLQEVIDSNSDGNPDVVLAYQVDSGTIFDLNGGYAPESWDQWVRNIETDINDTDTNDGWSGGWNSQWGDSNCNLCGNIQGEVNSILLGF